MIKQQIKKTLKKSKKNNKTIVAGMNSNSESSNQSIITPLTDDFRDGTTRSVRNPNDDIARIYSTIQELKNALIQIQNINRIILDALTENKTNLQAQQKEINKLDKDIKSIKSKQKIPFK